MNFLLITELVKAVGLMLIGIGLIIYSIDKILRRKNGKRNERKEV